MVLERSLVKYDLRFIPPVFVGRLPDPVDLEEEAVNGGRSSARGLVISR